MKGFSDALPEQRRTGNSLTPMIDCIFLLLIFFLYSRFRSPEAELGADVPPVGKSVAVVEDVQIIKRRQILIELSLGEGGTVIASVGAFSTAVARETGEGYAPETGNLTGLLRQRVTEEPESFVILKPGQDVPFGCVIWCFDSARLAGIDDVSFAPPEGEGLPDV